MVKWSKFHITWNGKSTPAEVSVSIEAGNVVTVKGPKGTLTQTFHPDMIIKQEGGAVIVNRPDDEHLLNPNEKEAHKANLEAAECPMPDWNVANRWQLIAFYQEFVRQHPGARFRKRWVPKGLPYSSRPISATSWARA